MNLQEFKNELITRINNLEINEFFRKIQESENITYSETNLNILKSKFIIGKIDFDYYESLKVFVTTIESKKKISEQQENFIDIPPDNWYAGNDSKLKKFISKFLDI